MTRQLDGSVSERCSTARFRKVQHGSLRLIHRRMIATSPTTAQPIVAMFRVI